MTPERLEASSEADPYHLDATGVREPPVGWRDSLKYLGPGLILSASIVGSGELIATTTAGAQAGFVILWLVVRSAALFFSARRSLAPLCWWVYLAAAVDFALAILLLAGLPVAVLVYGLFGQTDEILATFAWVFAASFIAAGWLLIAAAPLEASETD